MKTGIKVRKTSGTMANLGGASSGILVKDHDNSCGHVMDGEPAEEELGKRALWLLSISQKHAKSIQHTREYREFLVACERLKNAHRKVSAWKGNCIPMEDESLDLDALDSQSGFSFLQYVAADDILLRVFEFLESQSLVASRMTCSRFCELADRSAARRVHHVAKERQLSSNMMLLRAKEQIEGVAIDAVRCHVRVPTLLLSRRVRVTNAGDPCYNGIFHCTGSNGNGFVFTKPREPAQRVDRRSLRSLSDDVILDLSRDESEVARPGKLLRCIIAKRFSNEVRDVLECSCLQSVSIIMRHLTSNTASPRSQDHLVVSK
jgi:hypothetical protein